MRHFVRIIGIVLFALVLCVPAAGPAPAQQSTAEGLSEEALSKLSDLQSAAQQFAQQQGQFAGKSIGPQLASASNQLLQVLLNFDIWACGTSVTALHLKRQRLAVAAAGASPPDPALDRAVDDFGRLISQLQELCDRHVHRIYGPPTGGSGGAGTTPQPPVEQPPPPPPPPTMTVQERICYDRCHNLYVQFLRAELDYDRARREAEAARTRARERAQEARQAADRARAARQRAEETQREYDRLQAAMTAARTQPERLRLAERLSRVNPQSAREFADSIQREADAAARAAEQAEARATRSETQASSLHDAMVEIYEAWLRCARNCAEQARTHDRITIDPFRLFTGMPQSPPRRPPFYRPAPSPVLAPAQSQQSSVPLNRESARLLAIHNAERAAVGVPPLRWNAQLEQSATDYARQLARTGQLVHAPREGRGIVRENLSQGLLSWSPDQMINGWTKEKQNFTPGRFPNVARDGNWLKVAHFTQMIWPTTTDVGCGMVSGRGYKWLVCRYSPGGNKDGQPVGRR